VSDTDRVSRSRRSQIPVASRKSDRPAASGFLLRNAPLAQLVAAVRETAAGEAQIAPAIVQRMVEEFVRRLAPGTTRPTALDELTARELKVLKLIARAL
jgi:DNA-binding NarL/FixJ family response regulator